MGRMLANERASFAEAANPSVWKTTKIFSFCFISYFVKYAEYSKENNRLLILDYDEWYLP